MEFCDNKGLNNMEFVYNGLCPVELSQKKLNYGNIDFGILKEQKSEKYICFYSKQNMYLYDTNKK